MATIDIWRIINQLSHVIKEWCCNCPSLMYVKLLHGQADGFRFCWSCRTSSTCRISHSLWRSISNSNRRYSFSRRTNWFFCIAKLSRFLICRFATLSRFTWLLRFSRCFCFRIRDRLADSRFDIMRLCFRSSMSEPELEFLEVLRFGSGEPESWVVRTWLRLKLAGSWEDGGGVTTTTGSCAWKTNGGSWSIEPQGNKPGSKIGNMFSRDENMTGAADNMGEKTSGEKGRT